MMENYESDVSPFRLDDLKLAAELGKSLLERNTELEEQLKACESKTDEQDRQILYLRRHINDLSEENESRVKVYEQLDLMLQQLERVNQRLSVEKSRDKDQIKLLVTNIEILETRCEQLTHQLNIARQSLDRVDRYRQERNTNSNSAHNMPSDEEMGFPEIQPIVLARHDNIALCHSNLALSLAEDTCMKNESSDDLIRLLGEMETVMRDFLAERRRCAELEEQMRAVIQENQFLQRRLAENTARQQQMMSVRDEVSLLDEVRQGKMCSRCLGNIHHINHINNNNNSNFNLNTKKSVVMRNKYSQTDEPKMAMPILKDEFAGMVSTIITELEHKINTAPKKPKNHLMEENGRELKVLQREPIEPKTLAAGIKKKNRRKHRQSFDNLTLNNPKVKHCDSPISHSGSASPSPSMAFSGKWNGTSMTIYNKDMQAPTTSQGIIRRCPKTLGDYFPSTFPGFNSQGPQ